MRTTRSPILLLIPDVGEKREYGSGAEVVEDSFDRRYQIKTITAVDSCVHIELRLSDTVPKGTMEDTFF